MKITLSKMNTKHEAPIAYELGFDESKINLNSLIHKEISICWDGVIICRKCAKKTKKSFGEGFCYPCFMSAPEASPCILKPELCQAHLGMGRDLEYEEKNHNKPHAVYLAATDKVKVGVTRTTQIPTRWIDQGAHQAVGILELPNRYLAGIAEVSLKNHFSDKTNWRKMLQNDYNEVPWEKAINLAIEKLPQDLRSYLISDPEVSKLNFPVLQYPEGVKSLKLEKEKSFSGILKGIKGQYLIFDDQTVCNIRSNEGAVVEMNIN